MVKWKVPVSVVTGYLGAGKTTLLKNMIEKSDRKLAILMNEFGDVGIDTKIIKGTNVDMVELLGGCVCCSLTGELGAAIKEILSKVRPDMIVIETTGVAEPDSLVTNLDGIDGVSLDSVITVVDVDSFLNYPNIGHTGKVQIEVADVILMNKVDLVPVEKMNEFEDALREMNPNAKIIRTTYSNVDPSSLFGFKVEKKIPESTAIHSAAVMDSFVYSSERVHDRSRFLSFVSKIPKEVYRSKGYIVLQNGPHLFNFVNGRYDVSEAGEGPTEIVFIGMGIEKFRDQILSDLAACRI